MAASGKWVQEESKNIWRRKYFEVIELNLVTCEDERGKRKSQGKITESWKMYQILSPCIICKKVTSLNSMSEWERESEGVLSEIKKVW